MEQLFEEEDEKEEEEEDEDEEMQHIALAHLPNLFFEDTCLQVIWIFMMIKLFPSL